MEESVDKRSQRELRSTLRAMRALVDAVTDKAVEHRTRQWYSCNTQ